MQTNLFSSNQNREKIVIKFTGQKIGGDMAITTQQQTQSQSNFNVYSDSYWLVTIMTNVSIFNDMNISDNDFLVPCNFTPSQNVGQQPQYGVQQSQYGGKRKLKSRTRKSRTRKSRTKKNKTRK